MPPPTKRQKRNVVPSSSSASGSDGGDEANPGQLEAQSVDLISSPPTPASSMKRTTSRETSGRIRATQTKLQPQGKAINNSENSNSLQLPNRVRGGNGSTKSTSVSPEKPKRKGKGDEKGKSGNIFTFFTKQAQRQQAGGARAGTTIPKPTATFKDTKAEDYDIISDDDVFEGIAKTASVVGLAAGKRARSSQALKNSDQEAPNLSQRFVGRLKPTPAAKTEEDLRPWAERFAPTNLDELAVHKKKVVDVRRWLDNVIDGRMRQRLLLLKGPAGTGKTTTVQLLAQAMDCEVLEWRNPVGSVATAEGFQSMSAQFEEFLGRGGKFGQLDIFSADDEEPLKSEPKPLGRRKRIILVEEFPNTFTRSSSALQSFRAATLQYLASNTPSLSMFHQNRSLSDPVTPIVMVVSETLLTTTSASADSFTAHRLLGPEILQHPGVGVIEFNPIAPTLLAKALDTLVQKESRKSGRRKTPGPLVLKKLGEIGDIRSAIGSLEFLCLRGDEDGDWGAKVAFGKAKKGSKDATLTAMEEESLEMVTRREASLGIFHAVGKVVYNKRDESNPQLPAGADVEQLPAYMSSYARPRRSQIPVDDLIDETGTDTQTFIAALHENYLLSCEAPPSSFEFSSLDHVNGCIDALSDSDLLCPSWDGSFNSSGFGGGTGGRGTGGDIIRQDEIAFQIAVRGILFSLPYPVKRKPPPSGGLRTGKGGDAFKMFYPTSLKLWKMKEEIESTIDHYVARLMKCEDDHLSSITAGAAAFAKPKLGAVENWSNARVSQVPNPTQTNKGSEPPPAPLLSMGTSARKEMLLERLPYMLLLAKARGNPSSTRAIKDIEKVATFHGIGGPSEDSLDEGDDNAVAGEAWATDRAVEGGSPKKKGLVVRGRGIGMALPLPQFQEQKFVLSDDDIEDD